MSKALPKVLPPGLRDSDTVAQHYAWFENYPQVYSVVSTQADDFLELRFKARSDGVLAICRRSGADGGPEVCFGTSYDVIGALAALERAIAGNKWKVDRPWSPTVEGSTT